MTFATTQLQDKTQFNGDITIDTSGWTDEQITSLQEWVAKVTLIFGDLSITHGDADNVIKFAALTGVTILEDKQPHAHYPELASANEIKFTKAGAAKVETVRLPKITTTKFTDGTIDLSGAGTELHLDTFTEHAGNLSITLNGAGITNLGVLKQLTGEKTAQKTLQLIGFSSVDLPALTTLKKLHVKDVNSLTAVNVKGLPELQISQDVSRVDVGTADGGAVTKLTIDSGEAERDLEHLKIGGDAKLEVTIPTGVEVAHIHGAKSVKTDDSDDLDTFVTAREINQLTLTGTDIETLELGHTIPTDSKDGGIVITNNESLESLTADSVNNLKTLKIQGNTRLETISFTDLDTAASGAVVHIGGVGNKNRLRASEIHLEVKTGAGKQDGNIVDESGLSDLKAFLGSSNITTAEVYYDGTDALKESKTDDDPDSIDISADNIGHLVLFRKGVPKGAVTEKQAKRVFVVTIDGINTATSGITIGVDSAYRPITLDAGGSPANWVSQVNASEVKSFFNTNNVLVEASVGGNPTGNITFGGVPTDATVTVTAFNALGLPDEAYVKLSIGKWHQSVFTYSVFN